MSDYTFRPIGNLGGYDILSSSTVAWTIQDGVTPAIATFDLAPEDADKLLAGGLVPVDLILGPLLVKNLYVIQEVAPDVPGLARVQVADRRWFWSYRMEKLGFNIRRKLGNKYLEEPNRISGARTVVDTVLYAPWSMKGPGTALGPVGSGSGSSGTTPWKAHEVLDVLLERLVQAEYEVSSVRFQHIILKGAEARLSDEKATPIENLFLEGDLASCLGQLLDYLPGVGVYVDRDGIVVFYSRSNGGEAGMVQALGAAKVGAGVVRPVKLGRTRPSAINVCFDREVELRFDYNETSGQTTTPDALTMENVLPIPDFSLDVDGETLPQGTWITIQQALTAWGTLPLVRGPRPITIADLQRAAVPFNGLVEAIGALGIASYDVDWMSRIVTALTHYRRTFRINKRWMDRIFQLKATRVGTLDFATGSRGKSLIFSDYSYLGTLRSIFHDYSSGAQDGSYVRNSAIFSGGVISQTTPAAPGQVHVVDEDLGIISFDYFVDVAQVYGTVFPSQVELNGDNTSPGSPAPFGGPSGNLTSKTSRPRAWDILIDPTRYPKLTANHKCATILSATPGMGGFKRRDPKKPTEAGQFHVIQIKPSDVHPFAGQDDCTGPIMEVHVGAGLETARVPWLDADSNEMQAAFGLTAGTARLNEIVLNAKGQGASLDAIALATAERIYHRLADRNIGSMTGTLVPDIEPGGWLSSVEHSIQPSGEMSTRVGLPDAVPALDIMSYLPPSTKRQIMKLANQGG